MRVIGGPGDVDKPTSSQQRISWARLLKKVFDIDVEACPRCGDKMKIIAAVVHPSLIEKILKHLGLPHQPPKIATSRGPPPDPDDFAFDQQSQFDD